MTVTSLLLELERLANYKAVQVVRMPCAIITFSYLYPYLFSLYPITFYLYLFLSVQILAAELNLSEDSSSSSPTHTTAADDANQAAENGEEPLFFIDKGEPSSKQLKVRICYG